MSARPVALLCALALAASCYPHRGRPALRTDAQWAEAARAACERRDRAAWRALSKRAGPLAPPCPAPQEDAP